MTWPAFATIVQQGAGALLVAQDAFLVSLGRISHIGGAVRRISVYRIRFETLSRPGFVSYGPDFADGYHKAVVYVGKVLKCEAR